MSGLARNRRGWHRTCLATARDHVRDSRDHLRQRLTFIGFPRTLPRRNDFQKKAGASALPRAAGALILMKLLFTILIPVAHDEEPSA